MKKSLKQIRLVQNWNVMHSVGTDVIVTKDDGTNIKTKTSSPILPVETLNANECPNNPWMRRADMHPNMLHTTELKAVILLEGISGCYALERVREA